MVEVTCAQDLDPPLVHLVLSEMVVSATKGGIAVQVANPGLHIDEPEMLAVNMAIHLTEIVLVHCVSREEPVLEQPAVSPEVELECVLTVASVLVVLEPTKNASAVLPEGNHQAKVDMMAQKAVAMVLDSVHVTKGT